MKRILQSSKPEHDRTEIRGAEGAGQWKRAGASRPARSAAAESPRIHLTIREHFVPQLGRVECAGHEFATGQESGFEVGGIFAEWRAFSYGSELEACLSNMY